MLDTSELVGNATIILQGGCSQCRARPASAFPLDWACFVCMLPSGAFGVVVWCDKCAPFRLRVDQPAAKA